MSKSKIAQLVKAQYILLDEMNQHGDDIDELIRQARKYISMAIGLIEGEGKDDH